MFDTNKMKSEEQDTVVTSKEEEDFLEGAKVCSIWDPECEACQ